MCAALSYFGLNADTDLPAVVIHDTDKDIKFKVVGVSAGSLESTVASYMDGSLKPFIKSEPVPQDNSGPVKTAVADNWAEVMEVDTADSLVMFYAPWCVRERDRRREKEGGRERHRHMRCARSLKLPFATLRRMLHEVGLAE